jgi:zinc/manganese transport system substrate-binding protein
MGDIHPGGSPHYLFDPRQAVAVARGVAGRMADLDGAGEAAYRAGLDRFVARIEAARAEWERRLAPLRGAPVLGYHKSWVYLADWLGLRVIEHLEPKPGIPPNPSHVARVLALGRRHGVRAILQEAFYPDATGRLIAEKIPAALVRLPGGAAFDRGQSYVQHVDEIVARLAKASPKGGG